MTTGTPPPYEFGDSPFYYPLNCSDWKRSEVIDILNPNATCQISLVHPKINLLQGTGGLVKIQAVKRGPIKFIPLVCGGEKWRCDDGEGDIEDEYMEELEHNACIVLGQNKSIELQFRPEWGTYKSVVLGNKVIFSFYGTFFTVLGQLLFKNSPKGFGQKLPITVHK